MFRSLFLKFLLVLVPLFLALEVPGLYMLVRYEARDDVEALASRIGGQAARIAQSFTRHDTHDRPLLAQDLIAAIATDPAFLCAELKANATDRVLAAAPPHIGCIGQAADNELALPVGEDGARTLIVRFTDAEIVASQNLRQTLMLLVVGLGFLVAAVAASLGFHMVVNRPLGQMLSVIRRNAGTGERTPIEGSRRDELGVLSEAFNDMLRQDAEREQALIQSNAALRDSREEFMLLSADLESRVRQRTADLKQRELALAESEQRFRDFSQASSDWYWEMDEALRFSYFSDRFSEITGVDKTVLLGKTREETGLPNVDPEQWKAHLHALHNRLPFRNFIHPRTKPGVGTVWLSINGVPYYSPDGVFKGFRGTGNDITALVEARVAAEAASRAKSEFLATMSHEIRTPMNGVLGLLGLLRKSVLDAQQTRFINLIQQSAESLLGLLDNLLDLSKIEAEQIELDATVFQLPQLVADVDAVMRVQAVEKGLNYESRIAPATPTWLLGDGGRTKQVLLNIVGNAIKFTAVGSVDIAVSHRAAADGRYLLQFEITDTGIGIDTMKQDLVFEKFAQADNSTTRLFGGTGLGLAICRELVELMGGTIELDSTPGVGSTFRFTVMCEAVDAAEAEMPKIPPPIPQDAARPLHILLAEDNPVNREIAVGTLMNAGHRVDHVENGNEAIQAVQDTDFDAVLMDVHMPVMDGLTATRKIRRLPDPVSAVPIIALTANAMVGDREKYLACGMNDYISKPFSEAELLETLIRNVAAVPNKAAFAAAPPPNDARAAPCLDPEVVEPLRTGKPDLWRRLTAIFLSHTTEALATLQEALQAGDGKTLNATAHSLKSSSANMGALPLSDLFRQLEAAGSQSDFDKSVVLLEQIEREFHIVSDALEPQSQIEEREGISTG